MSKSKKKNKKKNNQNRNNEQQKQGGIRREYRIGALVICAIIVVSLVAMYAFI